MPFAPWLVAALIALSGIAGSSTEGAAKQSGTSARLSPWPCRLIPVPSLRSVIEKGMEQSETIRRQCDELANAGAVVALEWETATDSLSQARTRMGLQGGVVVATVKLPPLGDTIVLMAHELQHVVEQTRGLDLAAEVRRPNSGVWQAYAGHYETRAAVDVSRKVAQELRDNRHSRRK
jgi:hypothetical protein